MNWLCSKKIQTWLKGYAWTCRVRLLHKTYSRWISVMNFRITFRVLVDRMGSCLLLGVVIWWLVRRVCISVMKLFLNKVTFQIQRVSLSRKLRWHILEMDTRRAGLEMDLLWLLGQGQKNQVMPWKIVKFIILNWTYGLKSQT